ncbi:bacterial cell division membrane protein [secondary endosymbiont of Heteropsylla cubana]|uniref:Probable peptidoglycan glycosyltransferase FtsW n=1 Tax=secondary endosymbiont of Heteropsylla cubana TaxID=134287 RepID=J3VU97_9ENTR|nr:bacterial cell division membrane protein [secondary endosymbiont of Heteropsylla cubana]
MTPYRDLKFISQWGSARIINTYQTTATYLLYDHTLLWLILGLISIGFVMVTSASMPIGIRLLNDCLHFAKHDALYIDVSFLLSLVTLNTAISTWQRYISMMLLVSIVLLLATIIISSSSNRTMHWITVGPIRIQPAKLSKLSFFCYLSSYLVKKEKKVCTKFWGICKPISVIVIMAILLLAQPDLGSTVILFVSTLSMLFLAGAKLYPFFFIIVSGIFLMILLIIIKPYRIQRLMSFWNP